MTSCLHSSCSSSPCLYGGPPSWSGVAQGVVLLPMSQGAQGVTEVLQEQGFTHIRDVNGGMSEWAQCGWSMFKRKTWWNCPSLDIWQVKACSAEVD